MKYPFLDGRVGIYLGGSRDCQKVIRREPKAKKTRDVRVDVVGVKSEAQLQEATYEDEGMTTLL